MIQFITSVVDKLATLGTASRKSVIYVLFTHFVSVLTIFDSLRESTAHDYRRKNIHKIGDIMLSNMKQLNVSDYYSSSTVNHFQLIFIGTCLFVAFLEMDVHTLNHIRNLMNHFSSFYTYFLFETSKNPLKSHEHSLWMILIISFESLYQNKILVSEGRLRRHFISYLCYFNIFMD